MSSSLFTDSLKQRAFSHLQKEGDSFLVSFLNRHDSRATIALEQIENLWGRLKAEDQRKIRARITSFDDSQFLPALYEILFSDFLVVRGYSFSYEEDTGSSTPDFLVSASGYRIAMELVFVDETTAQKHSVHELKRIALALAEKFPNERFNINLHEFWPKNKSVNTSHIIETIMESSSTEEQGILFSSDIYGASFSIQRKETISTDINPSTQKVFCFWSPDNTEAYRKKLVISLSSKVRKVKNYASHFDFYIIVVCPGGLSLNEFVFMNTLYGRQQVRFMVDNTQRPEISALWKRDWSGFFTQNPGQGGEARNKKVSAVVSTIFKTMESGRFYLELEVYHNPFASAPLPVCIFNGSPQLIKDDRFISPDSIQMCWIGRNGN